MNVLIATSGALSPEPAARIAAQLAADGGSISAVTVIEVPRSFLDEIRSEQWHPLDPDTEWGSREDAVIARYVDERGRRLTDPLGAALRAMDIEASTSYLEGEDPAKTIAAAAKDMDADVIVMGATRPIFDESSWESVSMRVVQEGTLPVVIVPASPRPPEDEETE